uniref:Uncharacterized protein n=1 Tax=Leersia perrieri TaxID=77586 RepID=A0A0D9WYD4_9ORYZ
MSSPSTRQGNHPGRGSLQATKSATRTLALRVNPETNVHLTSRHDLSECHSVWNLAERVQRYEQEKRDREKEARLNGKAPAELADNRRKEAKSAAPAGGEDDNLGYQDLKHIVATIDGGAHAQVSRRSLKAMRRELLAAAPSNEAARRSR